jgi:hypothetical protein
LLNHCPFRVQKCILVRFPVYVTVIYFEQTAIGNMEIVKL